MTRADPYRCVLATLGVLLCVACANSSVPSGPTAGAATISAAALAYIDEMLGVMQHNALHRSSLDWAEIRRRVVAAAGNAQSVLDVHRWAVGVALALLRDNHSLMFGPTGSLIAAAPGGCGVAAFSPAQVPPNVGYVRVAGFSGSGAEALAFTARIHSTIVDSDRDDLRGWIVDLRSNTGGNMWPMLAGLIPILGDGVLGYFIHPDESELRWEIRGNAVWFNGASRMQAPSTYIVKRPAPAVAVLTDGLTGSSGEAVAVAFRARPNTRSFGIPTCGVSTANTGFPLSDGSNLVLTVAVMADRTRTKYGARIEPDEIVTNPTDMVSRASAWLLQ